MAVAETEEEVGYPLRSHMWKHEAMVDWINETEGIDLDTMSAAEIVSWAFAKRAAWRNSAKSGSPYRQLLEDHKAELEAEREERKAERAAEAEARKAAAAEAKAAKAATAKAAPTKPTRAPKATKTGPATKAAKAPAKAAKAATKAPAKATRASRKAPAADNPFE
jgi:hypothetical protein